MQRKSHSAHRSRKPQEISNLNKTTKNSRQTSPNSGDGIWKHYKKPKKKTGRNKDSKNWKDPSTVEHKSKRKINRLYLEYGTPIRNPKFQQISPSPSAHSSSEEESRELLMSIEGFSKRHKPYIEEESVLNTIQREYKEKENIRKANDRKFLIKRDTVALSSMNAKTRQRYSVLHPVIDPLIILHTPQKASKTPDSSPKRYYSPKLRTTKNKHAPKARDLLQIPPDFEELQREIVDEHDHPENKKTFPRKSVSIDLKYKTIQMMEDAHRKYKKFAEEGRKVLKVPKQWDQQQSVVEKIMGIHLIRNTRVGKAITHEWVLTLDRKEKMKFMHAPMHIKKMTRDQMIKSIRDYYGTGKKRLLHQGEEALVTKFVLMLLTEIENKPEIIIYNKERIVFMILSQANLEHLGKFPLCADQIFTWWRLLLTQYLKKMEKKHDKIYSQYCEAVTLKGYILTYDNLKKTTHITNKIFQGFEFEDPISLKK